MRVRVIVNVAYCSIVSKAVAFWCKKQIITIVTICFRNCKRINVFLQCLYNIISLKNDRVVKSTNLVFIFVFFKWCSTFVCLFFFFLLGLYTVFSTAPNTRFPCTVRVGHYLICSSRFLMRVFISIVFSLSLSFSLFLYISKTFAYFETVKMIS